MDRNTSGIESVIDNISRRAAEMTPLMHHIRVSEDICIKNLGLQQLPFSCLVRQKPLGTELLIAGSVEDIQVSTFEVFERLFNRIGQVQRLQRTQIFFAPQFSLDFTILLLNFNFSWRYLYWI